MNTSLTKSFAALISILLIAISSNAQITSDQSAEIDKLFAAWDKNDSPGAAVGVIRDGRLIFSKGYGMADLEHDVPITPASVFYAASVSKQFVTMAILLLEEDGKLSLDDEIQKYLPDFPRYEGPLTIRNFIHHTSGVRDSLTLWSLSGRDIYDYIPKEAMYELIKRQKELNFKPGEEYLYSNACYFMLALIVEKVSGQSIKDFAEEHMFKPLGMKDTHFHDDLYHIVKNRVFSYSPSPKGYRNLILRFDLVGSGGLYTNVNDLLLWDRNFYNNKLGKGRQELIEKMQTDGRLNNGESAGYAFGLSNGRHKGLRTVGHGGALAGYRTYLVRYPDENFSVIVLANVSSFDSGGKAREVAEIFLKDKFTERPGATVATGGIGDGQKVTLTEAEMSPFVSKYLNREAGILVEISYEGGELKFRREENEKVPMLPMSRNAFRVRDEEFILTVTFRKAANGEPAMTAAIDNGPTFEFESYKPAEYSAKQLSDLAGRYYSEEIDATYELRSENGELVLHVAGRRMGPLKPITAGFFMNPEIGYFEFKGDGAGMKPPGFTLDAGRVRNLKFERR